MDLEQLAKRLDWLDEERRKDKTIKHFPGLLQQVKELSGDLTRLSMMLAKFDLIDSSVAQLRVDLTRSIETVDKSRIEREREMDKARMADHETLTKAISEVRRGLDPIPDLRKSIQARMEEDFRIPAV